MQQGSEPIRSLTRQDLRDVEDILSQHTSPAYTADTVSLIGERLDDDAFLAVVYEVADDIRGFATGITYDEDVPTSEYDIRHPTVTYPEGALFLLRHVYVDDDWRGHGIGTTLSSHLLATAEDDFDVAGAFGESWVKTAQRSSEELFNKLGFEQRYYSESYYDDADIDPDHQCRGCNNLERNCECAGAIFVRE